MRNKKHSSSYFLSRGEVLGLVVESHHTRELQVLQHDQILNILRLWVLLLTALRTLLFRLINKQYRALRPSPKAIAASLLLYLCHSLYCIL